jgi:organic hydroperoxide reductase OsmC/OhrA
VRDSKGINGGVSLSFGLNPDEPLPSTLDYVVAAVDGCMTGTIAGALEARGIRTDPDKLEAVAEGPIEEIDGKTVLTNITVRYRLNIPKDKHATAERALEHDEGLCPVSNSVRTNITVEWKADLEDEEIAATSSA